MGLLFIYLLNTIKMATIKEIKKKLTPAEIKIIEALELAYNNALTSSDSYKVSLKQANEDKAELVKTVEAKDLEIKTLKETDNSEEFEALKVKNLELEALKEKNPASKLITEGTFVKGSGKTKKTYKFKDGFVKTRARNGEVIKSSEALKDDELMNHLIGIGYAGLELVK